ncbi:hypothetical protein LEP1GSC188_4260 [Leptospira weilii serovar Topaz str. LT2116]|uniref:Uncharacterized protein n=1 Tax=Leptospira weilii serovar Topaz str. LT2116 TaxID=1088540 RepID=M3FU57_9LEPT|nr:hypothetical protein LEP1GSC188_4260 [Leptospira weilii serovar Topaz str. LT2116]
MSSTVETEKEFFKSRSSYNFWNLFVNSRFVVVPHFKNRFTKFKFQLFTKK